MNELIEFLTSKEIMIVYCVAFLSCLLCVIIYIVEKNNDKFRKKQNTKELNKLVEQVQDEVMEEEIPVSYSEEPVLLTINPEESALNELLEPTIELESIEELKEEKIEEEEKPFIIEPIDIVEDELEYTTIEPDQEEAKEELRKITEELQKEEEIEKTGAISLSNYEEQQEADAIISLDELLEKGKDIYKANEVSQYADEGNEPISINELNHEFKSYDEPFIIDNVISKEEYEEVEKEIEKTGKIELDDFNKITISNKESTFKSSPIISPVYGIEKSNDLELENTANYEKFDNENRTTNEFLMSLVELQDKN